MPPSTMRAAVARAREQIEIDRIPVPTPQAGEVRVRVQACGVCGTDVHIHHNGYLAPNVTPGHEMAGEVDEVGDGVDGFAAGDLVVVEPLRSCGICSYCRAGMDAICPELRVFGIHLNGGFAEFTTVPARRLFHVPPDLDPCVAALCEPMAVVVHGLHRGRFAAGQRVLVIGAGSIGLLAAKAAASLGAGDVWLTARHPHQAELGRALGAHRVLGESEAAASELARFGVEHPFDCVLETVGGTGETLRLACAAVRPGGTVSVLGVFMREIALDPFAPFLKETTIAWSNCYSRPGEGADFQTAVELVDRHRDELALLNTHTVSLDEVDRALDLAADRKAGSVKVTVVP